MTSTAVAPSEAPDPAADASDVTWDLEHLVDGRGEAGCLALLDEADSLAAAIAEHRGGVAALADDEVVGLFERMAALRRLVLRAHSYAGLRYAADSSDAANGALVQRVTERTSAINTRLLFVDLEWLALPDDRAESILARDDMAFARHHLEAARRQKPYVLSEAEERILNEKAVTGRGAWSRLFGELQAAIKVTLDGRDATLEEGLSRLQSPDRDVRAAAAAAVTAGLAPGLRTRAYIFNTLLLDKAVDDRLRGHDHWIQGRNLANEASDESVQALVDAVVKRYDIPHRWYALKARMLGLDRIADFDRMASVADEDVSIRWDDARDLVVDCYRSFSPQLGDAALRFFDERWIDAANRPGKRPGAFCAYTSPDVHPYVLMSWTQRRGDVLTLAHELGHGLHAHLAAEQGVYHQSTPLTVAETASVFGETVVFGRLLEEAADPASRLALLAESLEGAIATVFRQVAMNRFEEAVHTARREEGELSVDRFAELWTATQADVLGPAVEITEGYRTWWSYIPHFIATPGYVYAYAYGQLLALSVYHRYEEQGPDFVPRYLHLLAAGGSMAPEDLGRIVGCDLADPGFWDGGLALVERQLEAAETAAFEAGRLS